MNLQTMRRVIATFLLVCLGIMLPTAASPVRICFLQEQIITANVGPDSSCCPDCTKETHDSTPCCVDLETMPDAATPQPSIERPPIISISICENAILGPLSITYDRKSSLLPQRVWGPTSPTAHRAVLGIWRL